MEYKFIHSDNIHSVKYEKKNDSYKFIINEKLVYEVDAFIAQSYVISFRVKDKIHNVYLVKDNAKTYLSVDGEYYIFELEKGKSTRTKAGVQQKGNGVSSPMPGLIVKVPVSIGDKVSSGTILAIVEAMKMQNELPAPRDGTVKNINFKEGEQVDAMQVIVELDT